MKNINKKISIPLSKQIKNYLLGEIKKRKIAPGEKILSETKLAKKFKVSRMTAREALLELINEGYLYRVFGKGTFLKEDIEEKKILKKKFVIKVPNLKNSFYYQIISGAEIVFTHNNYEFNILTERDNQIMEKEIFEKILKEEGEGLLLVSSYYTYTNLSILKKIKEKMPIVIVDVKIPNLKVDTVISDDFKGGYMATEHLIEQNYKNILHLAGPNSDSSAEGRKKGYIECMKNYKLKPEIRYTRWTVEDGYFETKKVFLNRKEIEGIFCCNDEVAIGAYRALKELNLRVPEDVVIVGYGNIDISRVFEVPFTTVDQSPEEMGKIAANLLIEKIEGKRKFDEVKEIKVETKLIIRESCGILNKR
ncbi:MAG: GntR family transcriptional regulator [Candidatus Omnitrophica bacterium]|nr:GntR family transcriptional regulator [Candidatus Omnitrophota bacterium]